MHFTAAYAASVIDKVCGDPPPRGIFYVVESDGVLAGMGGLRWVRDGVAEVKRIYERFGFVDRGPYEETEAPKELHPIVRFMEKSLTV